MPERISDAITGHAITKVARSYEKPTVAMMADALNRFPRYDLEDANLGDTFSKPLG